MTQPVPDSTDAAWEQWGQRDPYFGVLTEPRFRSDALTDETLRAFFDSGRQNVEYLVQTVRRYVIADFCPRTVLDFGCGVGRTLVHFAQIAPDVLGADVSPAMLRLARRNCEERGLTNVRLVVSDDAFSSIGGTFDLIHSFIVFQHISPKRGRTLVQELLKRLAPGGVGALHFLYSKQSYINTYGAPPAPNLQNRQSAPSISGDPEMEMNPYNMNEILFLLQCHGIQRFHADFTDHGGELGIFLFFHFSP